MVSFADMTKVVGGGGVNLQEAAAQRRRRREPIEASRGFLGPPLHTSAPRQKPKAKLLALSLPHDLALSASPLFFSSPPPRPPVILRALLAPQPPPSSVFLSSFSAPRQQQQPEPSRSHTAFSFHGRRSARGRAPAPAAVESSSPRGRNRVVVAEVGADAVPDQDVPAGGGPGGGRRHLVERGRVRLRGVAPRRVRKGHPAHLLQAQQLLELRAAAQHIRQSSQSSIAFFFFSVRRALIQLSNAGVQEERAGQVGVRQRLLPPRREAPAMRHPPPEGRHAVVRRGDWGAHGCGGGIAGVLRRGSGDDVVEPVPGAPDTAAVRRPERAAAARERAPREGARPHEEAL
jgi:hypothetical protein